MYMRGQNRVEADLSSLAIPRLASDQWMVDVLADLQEAARDRGMMAVVDQLAIATRVTKQEIARKRVEAGIRRPNEVDHTAFYYTVPPAGYRRN
ncbi:hypothetical protein DL237_07040 [Pseudooceanicola sediminis]|uniref:Uncharacterized protein n=2 Tax=Pseudooceanicola sediminis TaxID=2211117 RepID=A0A399J5Y1_9RHOB|nr:hypothetical protein DL237_07040 [Pseudooceanicola sediminis]|tara:strand:- start:1029 stop:1310 length:282 start_codon:yes stop_codon:yes gene_type:complete